MIDPKRQQLKKGRARLRSRSGMTMAEMLITVAIIIILMAVGFIALSVYQRMLAQTERDGYAKELFIAAQNHLTMSRGEGYLDVTKPVENASGEGKAAAETAVFGARDSEEDGVFYYIVNNGDLLTDADSTLIDIMLPFGSIDETVRTGGSYVVRYQPESGRVLDVFYCSTSGSPERFNHTIDKSGDAEYKELLKLRDTGLSDDKKGQRRTYSYGDDSVLGWYGGEDAAGLPTVSLKAPSIEVVNSDTLHVNIVDNNYDVTHADLKLILTGVTSGAQKGIALGASAGLSDSDSARVDRSLYNNASKTIKITLDDVTGAKTHFIDLGQDTSGTGYEGDKEKRFIAGEDVKIEAVAYSRTAFANIAFSEAEVENSLYESLSDIESDDPSMKDAKHAFIGSIRHLENLCDAVSHTGLTDKTADTEGKRFKVSQASQTKDLSWRTYLGNTEGKSEVFGYLTDLDGAGGYYPVTAGQAIDYDGLRHSITGVEADYSDNAGLFGAVSGGRIRNLELIDFDISTSGGSAGALAGTTSETNITNVVAHNGDGDDMKKVTVESTAGSAGGLAGTVQGGTVKYSAAALIVKGSGSAGGLIGTAQKGTDDVKVNACYSGGHTDMAEYYEHDNSNERKDPLYNVTATGSGVAGGLIGVSDSAEITNSYSTCSASADIAGGLAGSASDGGSVTHCYCTGLVSGTEDNAFIGSGSPAVSETVNRESMYYSVINEFEEDGAFKYKEPERRTDQRVIALDSDTEIFDDFVGPSDSWNEAVPYDGTLEDYYHSGGTKLYDLMTVTQLEDTDNNTRAKRRITDTGLGRDAKGSLFVNTHYGDWPAPELFIINER